MRRRLLFSILCVLLSEDQALLAQGRGKNERQPAPSASKEKVTSPSAIPSPIAIEWPPEGTYLRTPSVAVRVRASDAILSLSVNGISAAPDPDRVFLANPVPLPEGPVTLTARATGRDGRISTASVNVIADRTPPRVTVSEADSPLVSGALLRRAARPIVEASDPSPVVVNATLNGKPFKSGTEIVQDGSYTLEIEATDRAGNAARKSVFFRIDSRAPELARWDPPSGTVLRGDRVSVSGECEDSSSVTVAGIAASVYGRRFVARDVPLAPGVNTLSVIAKDPSGNETHTALKLIRDEVPPKLTLTSPAPGLVTREPSVVVRGGAEDEHLADVTIQGAAAKVTGPAFEQEVRLAEGLNRLTVVARDAAGNRTESILDVTRDSSPPSISISSPAAGTLLPGSRIEVVGEAFDANLDRVSVNGVPAPVEGRRFQTSVPLSTGANTITATAYDRAGNPATASVSVTRDEAALSLALDLPKSGPLRSAASDFTGSVTAESGFRVTVNGVPAEVVGSRFRVSGLKLNEGANTLTVRATDTSGKTGVATSVVAVDTVAPDVVSVIPADGAKDVPIAAVIRLSFSKPIDPASANASSIHLASEPGGEIVPISIVPDGKGVALLPLAALTERTTYQLDVSDSVADLAGNRLRKGQAIHFTTGKIAPPSRPELDPLHAAVCAPAVTITGKADAGARVRISGGDVAATAVASRDGSFSAVIALRAESVNALKILALDAQERASEPVALAVRADCTPPRVEHASYGAGRLQIVFSEPMDSASLARAGAIHLAASGGLKSTPGLRMEKEGTTAVFEDLEGSLATGVTVTVDTGVTDLAGNHLPARFVTSLAARSPLTQASDAGFSGQVFDDRVGRPLTGAVVTVVAINGTAPPSPAPSTITDSDGKFSLVVTAGEIALRASREGYTAALRVGIAAAGDSITVFDMRLTSETLAQAKPDGSADITDKQLHLTLPVSAVAASTTVRVAALSPQGLPLLPPYGWSPAAALSLEVGAATAEQSPVTSLASPATASFGNRFGYPFGTALVLAHYDAATRRYLATAAGSASISADGSTIQAAIPKTGVYAVLVADPVPNSPPPASADQPLAGVNPPSTDPILSATVASNPTDVLPNQTADITATLTLSAPVPSGYPVEVLVSETLTLVNNQQVQAPSFLEDLTLLRDGAGHTIVPFQVRPSAIAAQVALSVGYEHLSVKHYTFDLHLGSVLGSGGGTVTGPLGFSVQIPPSALTQTVPVTLSEVSGAGDLPIPVPTGYEFVAAVRLDLAGQTLASPAALKWATSTGLTGSSLVWVEVADVNGVTRPRFTGPGRYDKTTEPTKPFVETTPASVHNLPVPGVLNTGLYVLLKASQSLAYVQGKVFDVPVGTPPVAGPPVASAVVTVVVTAGSTSIVALSDGLGQWALPIPASGADIRAVRVDTGNAEQPHVAAQAAGTVATQNITLAATAPFVLSVAPVAASILPLDLPIVLTLSEPLNPATVGNTSIIANAGSTAIPGSVRLSLSGTQITFTPSGSWPGNSSVTLTLSSSVTDLQGYRLVNQTTQAVANHVVTYTTVDPTIPSDINPLLISMGLPTGIPPTVRIIGGPGAACPAAPPQPACSVIAVNDTTTVTASTSALSDGSFALSLPATTTDRVYVIIRRPGGAEIHVDPGPYRDDGGRVAYLGTRASDYITRDGIRVTVDEGSFSGPVALKVKPIAQTALPAPVPEGARFIGGIEFDPGNAEAIKPIDLAVAAPAGVTGGEFLVARAVEVLGETRWMVIDTARYDNGQITTRPEPPGGGGAAARQGLNRVFATQAAQQRCPQLSSTQPKTILDRVTRNASLMIMLMDDLLGFLAGVSVAADPVFALDFSEPFRILQARLPMVWVPREAKQQCYFAMPVPLNVPFDLLARDATTGLTLFQASISPITDPTNVTIVPDGLVNANPPVPRLMSGSPFIAQTFVPAATPTDSEADRRLLLPGVKYSFVVSGNTGTVKLYGDAGSVDKCPQTAQCPQSLEVSLTNNIQKMNVTTTASPDGSFSGLSLTAKRGEDLTFVAGTLSLAPTASIHFTFSTELAADPLKSALSLKDNGTAVDFDLVPDLKPKSRGFTLKPRLPFASEHLITLTFAGGGQDQVPTEMTVKMSSPKANVIGARPVKDVNSLYLRGGLLLEVTGDAGNPDSPGAKLNLYDVSDPGSPVRCSSLPLYAFARGVMMDESDRVFVAMGGGGTKGRVEVFRLSPYTGSGFCGGRTLLGEGTGPEDLDRSWTEVTEVLGTGLGVLPEGYPRKLTLLSRDWLKSLVLDQDPDSTVLPFITGLGRTDSSHDGKQDPDSPLRITGKVPPSPGEADQRSPWNQPVTVINHTTGVSWTVYAEWSEDSEASGAFTIDAKASSGDRLEFRVNAIELSVVGTEQYGLQGVELNKTVHLSRQSCRAGFEICPIAKRLLFSLGNLDQLPCRMRGPAGDCIDQIVNMERLTDVALLSQPALPAAGDLPAPGEPSEPTVLAAINRFGLVTFSLPGQGEQILIKQLGGGIPLFTFDQPPVFPNLWAVAAARAWPVRGVREKGETEAPYKRKFCLDTRWPDYRPSLAFVASSEGIFVVDVTKASVRDPGDPPSEQPSPFGEPAVIGLFKMTSAPSTVALDAARGFVYAGGPDGIAVYDMSDPCTLQMPDHVAQPNDPRRIAYIPLADENVNTAFVLDADTGVAFGAGDTGGNVQAFSVALQPPPLRFVADTDRDGVEELVGHGCPLGVVNKEKETTAPYCPDVVQVLANVFGKAGQQNPDKAASKEIVVELSSASVTGIALAETPPGYPRTKTYVALARQSDNPGDPGFNRYLSPPIVLIADPRARKDYQLDDSEKEDAAATASKPYSCHNCKIRDNYRTDAWTYAADSEGQTPANPVRKAIEHWAGEKLVARLAWDAASELSLDNSASYLTGFDLRGVRAEIPTTRGDLTPALKQPSAQNPSFLTTEAGVAVATHSGEAQTAWTDLAIKGRGLDFVLTRYYVSDVLHAGPFGRNIDSPLFARLRDLSSGDVDFYPGDGTRHTFKYDSNAKRFEAPTGVFLDLYRKPDLTFFLVYPDNTRLFFDRDGRLTKLIDRQRTKEDGSDGNELAFYYDGAGRLALVTDPTHRQVRFEYYPDSALPGSRGLISKVTDFDDRTVNYTYKEDGSGRLKTVDGPDPGSGLSRKPSTTLAWTEPSATDLKAKLYHGGELKSATDGEGRQVFDVAYQATKPASVKTVTLGGGSWQFDNPSTSTTVTDPNGNPWTYKHQDNGQATLVTDPGGAKTSYDYDPEGRLTSATRPMGGSVTYLYAGPSATSRLPMGNMVSSTETPRTGYSDAPLMTSVTYGGANLPTSVTGPDGTTTISRDAKGNPQMVSLPDSTTRTFSFDERGLLTSSAGAGTAESYTYFDQSAGPKEGYLWTRTGGGTAATYVTDNRGNVVSVSDSESRSAFYQVNKLDQVEQESRAGSQSTSTYNAAGQVVARDVLSGTDAQGHAIFAETRYGVDELGRLTSRIELDGTSSSTAGYGYDPAGNLLTATRSDAPSSSYSYDSRSRLAAVTNGSATTHYTYDDDGVRTSKISPRGFTTTYLVDGFGRMIASIDPTGVKTRQILDRSGRPTETRVTKVTGSSETLYRWTARDYDPMGRVTQEVRKLFIDPVPVGANGSVPTDGMTDLVTSTTYDAGGRVLTVTDPANHTTSNEYDPQGRLKKVTDAASNTAEYEYDGSGNKMKETVKEIPPTGAPQVFVTRFEYDGQNRLKKIIDPLTHETVFDYDPRGNRTRTTDAENHITSAEYDLFGRKVNETDANLGVTSYDYDLAGHLIHLRDARNNQTTFTYDGDGRLKTEARPDGKTWTYDYDLDGNRTSVIQPNGTTVLTTFDDLGRATQYDVTRGAGVLGPTRATFGLDPLGRIVSSATSGDTADVAETFKYDSLDRLLREEQKIGSGPNRVVAKSYDAANNLNGLTYPSSLALTYGNDPLNRVAAVMQAGSTIVTYHDVGARPFDRVLANGITQTYGYDTVRRLNDILSKRAAVTVSDVGYTLSPIGNKTTIARPDLGKKATYQFNPNSWITQEALGIPTAGGTPERQTDYTIDKVLNYSQIDERVSGSLTATKSQTVNSRNQYTGFAGSALTYDENGNLTGGAGLSGMTLAYDYESRLKKATKTDGSVVENLYDPQGRKVRETVTASGITKTTDYVLHGDQVLEQYTGTSLAARYVRGRGIDEIVRAELDNNADGALETTVFPLQDELGNVERLTDATGATLERYEYQGYGSFRIFDPAGSPRSLSNYGWQWLFQGREYSPTLNAYDFRARTLWAEMGRFGQEDPLGFRDSANLYQGLGGEWSAYSDPLGLEGERSFFDRARKFAYGVFDDLMRRAGLRDGRPSDPNRKVGREALEAVGIPASEGGGPPANLPRRFRHEAADASSVVVATGAVVGREAAIIYTQGKVGEFAARVVIGGSTRFFRTIQEATQFAQQQKAAVRYFEEGTAEARLAEAQMGETAKAATTGQEHHAVSRRIHKALQEHPELSGQYEARDPRFVTDAKDLASHRGYQTWHRELDAEVGEWIRSHPNASTEEFDGYLRRVYDRPEIKARFPNGLSGGPG